MFSPLLAAALGFLAGMVFLAASLFVLPRMGGQPRPKVEPMQPEEAVDDEVIAVLAAAAREGLQAPARLDQVHVHGESMVERRSRAGRADIMTSRRMEPER